MKNIIKYVTVVTAIIFIAGGFNFLECESRSKPKSIYTALSLSIGVPVAGGFIGGIMLSKNVLEEVGLPIVLGSFAVGPSAGHFYAQQWWRGIGFISARTALFSWTAARNWGNLGSPDELTTILMLGTLFITIADIAYVPNSVHKYNNAHSLGTVPQLNLDFKEKHLGLSFVCRI